MESKIYSLPNHVVENIINLIHRVDIKGGEWPAVAEIEHCLKNPVNPNVKNNTDVKTKSNDNK